MDVKLLFQPSYTMANVKLSASEEIRAESGAMVSMSGGKLLLKPKCRADFLRLSADLFLAVNHFL